MTSFLVYVEFRPRIYYLDFYMLTVAAGLHYTFYANVTNSVVHFQPESLAELHGGIEDVTPNNVLFGNTHTFAKHYCSRIIQSRELLTRVRFPDKLSYIWNPFLTTMNEDCASQGLQISGRWSLPLCLLSTKTVSLLCFSGNLFYPLRGYISLEISSWGTVAVVFMSFKYIGCSGSGTQGDSLLQSSNIYPVDILIRV